MRHWTCLGVVAVCTACNGGAHDLQRAQLERARPGARASAAGTVTQSMPAAPQDDRPALITVRGRGNSGPGVARPAAPTMPSGGGYVVRSAGHPVSGATGGTTTTASAMPPPPPPPSPAMGPAPTARPANVGATAHYRRQGQRGPSTSTASSSSGGGGTAYGYGSGRVSANTAPAATRNPSYPMSLDRAGGGERDGESAAAADIAVAPAAPSAQRMVVAPGTAPVPVAPTPGVTVVVTTPPVAAVPPVVVEEQMPAALLTAASVGDHDRRANYLEYLSRHQGEREELGLDMSRRLRVRVLDAQDRPVNYAQVTVQGAGIRFAARTHADGYMDFFPSVAAPGAGGVVSVTAEVEGVGTQAQVDLPSHNDAQDLTLRIPAIVQPAPPAIDLQFAIDVTGSMGDELRYVNREVGHIVQRIQAESPGVRVRVGATFYRDRYDSMVVQQIPFTPDVQGFAVAMQGVQATGGGDYPEDMDSGLDAAMNRMAWSEGPAVRVLVVIADAPPQHYADAQFRYNHAMADASRRGIRILPVAASGANRQVEYLFRAMGAFTSTPYVYLTDDSGVGGPHMEADTDRVGVERFNDLLTRLVVSDLRGAGMHEPGALNASAPSS